MIYFRVWSEAYPASELPNCVQSSPRHMRPTAEKTNLSQFFFPISIFLLVTISILAVKKGCEPCNSSEIIFGNKEIACVEAHRPPVTCGRQPGKQICQKSAHAKRSNRNIEEKDRTKCLRGSWGQTGKATAIKRVVGRETGVSRHHGTPIKSLP